MKGLNASEFEPFVGWLSESGYKGKCDIGNRLLFVDFTDFKNNQVFYMGEKIVNNPIKMKMLKEFRDYRKEIKKIVGKA